MNRYVSDPRLEAHYSHDCGGIDHDGAIIAMALLRRNDYWRNGAGLIMFNKNEIVDATRALLGPPSAMVLVATDRTGRDSDGAAQGFTHYRVDRLIEKPGLEEP